MNLFMIGVACDETTPLSAANRYHFIDVPQPCGPRGPPPPARQAVAWSSFSGSSTRSRPSRNLPACKDRMSMSPGIRSMHRSLRRQPVPSSVGECEASASLLDFSRHPLREWSGDYQKKWWVRPHDEPTIAQFAGW
jgi:hypothetical protein